MKLAGWVLLLSVMWQGSAQAAGPDAAAEPGKSTDMVAQPAQATPGKGKVARSKKSKPATRKAAPKEKMRQDAITETPAGSIEQSVQVKGVRG